MTDVVVFVSSWIERNSFWQQRQIHTPKDNGITCNLFLVEL
jgi:hypothetical protein